MRSRATWIGTALIALSVPATPAAEISLDRASLERQFTTTVRPFLVDQCLGCHGAKKQEGKLDLSLTSTVDAVVENPKLWETILDRIESEEMPPEDAARQPSQAERKAVIEWIRAVRQNEAEKNAGDPGPVLARRLSHAEYNYTVRDLTGVDIRPTREFPIDPANEAGFDNSGESLTMSPALLKKYLNAARLVADHLVLTPKGLEFAPDPAVTETDRDKYCVRRIVDFYERHKVDYAAYFLAAWKYQHREALGKPASILQDIATEDHLSARYLELIWSTLNQPWPEKSPLGELVSAWKALPDDGKAFDDAKRGSGRMRELVVRLRSAIKSPVETLGAKGISAGSQPLVLWRNRRLASKRREAPIKERTPDLDVFCRVFPDTFFVSERSPYFEKEGKSLRLLTAGFHLMTGYFRDDAPLYDLILDNHDRAELDELWRTLNFATLVPLRQFKDFIFFERAEPPRFMYGAEFDFARSEDKDASSEIKIKQLKDAYLVKARRVKANDKVIDAIETYFTDIATEIRGVEHERLAAESVHLAALKSFARRAYRRPLSTKETDEMLAFYQILRSRENLNHEDAIRDTLASILMSPHFLYRSVTSSPGANPSRLSDHELASRLSYFLWSSTPDAKLFWLAESGMLHHRELLVSETKRMLKDDKIRALALEFAGNWLDFRRFEEHNSVDRERFPSFTNDLRHAMAEEPIRFFVDMVQRNRSVLDLLDADHTFVNPILAKHYGMPIPDGDPDHWVRIDKAHHFGRGGLLPMAVFLTRNSPGLRTSPVKRGYWVVRRVLGEKIPPPPASVPELPKDEASAGDLSLPQLLAKHRDNKSCLGCHQRFDSVGLVFEGYGPVGDRRERDLGGRAVSIKATFPDGSEGDGLDGLRHYLSEKRHDDFLDNFCRKLLVYALGRTLLPSDDLTVRTMRERLSSGENRFEGLVEVIVTSPQFLKKRGRDDARN